MVLATSQPRVALARHLAVVLVSVGSGGSLRLLQSSCEALNGLKCYHLSQAAMESLAKHHEWRCLLQKVAVLENLVAENLTSDRLEKEDRALQNEVLILLASLSTMVVLHPPCLISEVVLGVVGGVLFPSQSRLIAVCPAQSLVVLAQGRCLVSPPQQQQ